MPLLTGGRGLDARYHVLILKAVFQGLKYSYGSGRPINYRSGSYLDIFVAFEKTKKGRNH
jgi:hypothetical protein